MHRAAAAVPPILLLLLTVPLAGCLGENVDGNQNLRAPKLVVASTADGAATLYVHAAFTSERVYDRIRLTVDNTTLEDRYVYALQHKTNRTHFHLTVHVAEEDARFSYEADLRFRPDGETVSLVTMTPEGPLPMQNATLPLSKVIPPVEVN